ncbi:YchJ family protein [Marinobacter sp. F4216]|uniref:YchJ family protein n=1 Tax=Marinobacter sp. F4216 TaxID=2874281 RepID=UPI001CBFFDB2|nr:YchJ family protein [Marinobacter sp. F4216]MBZ2169777.1 YchJ family protein [Marinobacter sp. F4216]
MSDSASTTPDRCPCGSGLPYEACCQPAHAGQAPDTPEALMRSRYSAFVLGLVDYLLASWHASTRPGSLNLDDSPRWASLQVLDQQQRGDRGQVHFRAMYQAGSGWGFLEERSDFVREGGRWFYVSGDTEEGVLKPGRNDPCPCGSGRKYKACCLR